MFSLLYFFIVNTIIEYKDYKTRYLNIYIISNMFIFNWKLIYSLFVVPLCKNPVLVQSLTSSIALLEVDKKKSLSPLLGHLMTKYYLV